MVDWHYIFHQFTEEPHVTKYWTPWRRYKRVYAPVGIQRRWIRDKIIVCGQCGRRRLPKADERFRGGRPTDVVESRDVPDDGCRPLNGATTVYDVID